MFRRMVLEWKRFTSFMEAQEALRTKFRFKDREHLIGRPCIYVLTDAAGLEILRIGQTQDLWDEYGGGRRYLVEAAMSGSGKCVFIAEAPDDESEREAIETALIWTYRPRFNDRIVEAREIAVEHSGVVPARFRSG
jgi:hypothetical protein